MPVRTAYEPGTPCWADLGTPDLEGAVAFYSGLLGWQIEIGPPETNHYSMAVVDGQPVAALADQQDPNMPVFWSTYLSTGDVDQTAMAVTKAGGTVLVPPMDVMEFGRMAVALDGSGAQISFWQPGTHFGAGLVNEPGTMCWNELMTRYVPESVGFYATVAGLQDHPVEMGDFQYHELQVDGTTVAGLMPMIGEEWGDLPSHWMVYFAVEDTDATAQRCTELGGTVSVPPTDIPPGRFAVLNDPQGTVFSVIELAEPPA